MNSTSGFPINVELPVVSCDLCRHKSFYPPGIWHGQLNEIPTEIHLQRLPAGNVYSRDVFGIVGCMTADETEATALQNGWKQIKYGDSFKLVCPKCQSILSELLKCVAGASTTPDQSTKAPTGSQE